MAFFAGSSSTQYSDSFRGDGDVGVPKRRTSKSRKGTRRAHDFLTPINLTTCPICKLPVPTHRVHKECLLQHQKTETPGPMPR
jgi:large subunit ribosomal protein L32